MSKRIGLVPLSLAAMLLVSTAQPQQASQTTGQQGPQRFYRFISEWSVSPVQVDDYVSYLEHNARPVFERLMNDGTIFDWGIYTTVIYNDDGVSHGYWFEGESIAALEKARAQLAKIPPSPIQAGAKHHDYLLRTLLRRGHEAKGANGYMQFNSTLIQPGKVDQWHDWWEKYQKPMYDSFLANGWVTMYELDTGEIHSMDPNMVYLVFVTPTAEDIDKINAAFKARGVTRSPDESRAINDTLSAIVVAGSHRDYLSRAVAYADK
jgi:hypothetical protein